MKIKALNGFKDILPGEIQLWRHVEQVARDVLERFHFAEIRLPILEKTELFARSIGSDTDIVEKEMYTFVDKQVTMRPEATASLMRAYIQHSMHAGGAVQRLFTIGPMFRHERPQKGRLRQFHQLDVEVLGSASARLDAELMALGEHLFAELGVPVSLEINSLGCAECRPSYRSPAAGLYRRAARSALRRLPSAQHHESAAGARLQERGMPCAGGRCPVDHRASAANPAVSILMR